MVRHVSVAIAGAGPAGLLTALALKRACPTLSYHVFERARAMRPSGGHIGLSTPNVAGALEAVGVRQAVWKAGIPRQAITVCDKHGGSEKVTNMPEGASLGLSWFDMQQALLDPLGKDHVSLGSGVDSNIKEDSEGRVTFTTQTGEEITCDLLIGADGNRSACRAYVQQEEVPEYVGAAVWRLFIPEENLLGDKPGHARVWIGECKVMVLAPIQRDGKSHTYCSGLAPWPEDKLADLNSVRYIQDAAEDTAALSAKLARFRSAFKNFQPDVVDWICKHAVPEAVLEHPMYALQPRVPWVRGCVGLVGDAAHVMPPNLSQGTPQALEDAVQLAASIKEHGATAAALAHYEAVRKERVIPIWDASTTAAIKYYRELDEESNPFNVDRNQEIYEFISAYKAPVL